MNEYVPRAAEPVVGRLLDEVRVVLIAGARQVGKSTLAQVIAGSLPDVTLRTLDEPVVRAAAADDPERFVRHSGLMVIDEVQREPELLLAIKMAVDREDRPGQFLLAGSTNVLAMPGITDTLPGRLVTVELPPLSQGEIERAPEGFVGGLFTRPFDELAQVTSALAPEDYVERAVRGGLPGIARLSSSTRRRALLDYVRQVTERDVTDLVRIRRADNMAKLVRILAAVHAQPLVVERIASAAGLKSTAVGEHIALLERLFLIRRIPAWSTNRTRGATAKAKVVFTDSGVAAALVGQEPDRLLAPGGAVGPLIEGFVLGEIQRQITNQDLPIRLTHYRTHRGVEVDAVLEDERDGRIVGIEVKAGLRVRSDDVRHLRELQECAGDRFIGGIVLSANRNALSLGDGFWSLPISALWTT